MPFQNLHRQDDPLAGAWTELPCCCCGLSGVQNPCLGSRDPAWHGVQVTLEVLYGTIQTIIFSCALYFASGFARRADKFWWFTLFLWCALLLLSCPVQGTCLT